ncbi:restriction endonuclease subunit S [Flavobacterium facile]|uniref:restriction endonuclease subunit S n=1 Tax=Flavobacterium facile TaxID=2893174 RepID=UPI002E765FEF|nr:restriction endonuclease subunit S [Flavobacterium sp. T-12]
MQKVKLNQLCTMQSGGTPSRSKAEYYHGTIPWSKISDLEKSNDGYIYKTEEHITDLGLKSINNRLFKKGTLLLAMYGSVGKTAIAKIDLSTNQAILGINIKDKNQLDIKYLKYWFTTIKEQLLNRAVGAALANISLGIVKELEIPLPNLANQQKIANILDKADELRQYNKQLIEKYEALTQSLFLDMFGDPVKNEKGWNLTKFSNVLTKIESGWSPVCENYSRRDENEWAVLKLGAVSYGTYNPNENKKYEFDIPNSKIDCEVKQGDLLFTRKNTYHMVGKTAFVYETESRLLLPDTVFRLVYNLEKANPLFLYYLLNHNKFSSEIQSLASGTSGSMPNISKAKLLAKDLICPSVDLQNQFAERVAVIETQKQQAQEALAKSEALFQGLLQQAFNGELNTPPYGHPS